MQFYYVDLMVRDGAFLKAVRVIGTTQEGLFEEARKMTNHRVGIASFPGEPFLTERDAQANPSSFVGCPNVRGLET